MQAENFELQAESLSCPRQDLESSRVSRNCVSIQAQANYHSSHHIQDNAAWDHSKQRDDPRCGLSHPVAMILLMQEAVAPGALLVACSCSRCQNLNSGSAATVRLPFGRFFVLRAHSSLHACLTSPSNLPTGTNIKLGGKRVQSQGQYRWVIS